MQVNKQQPFCFSPNRTSCTPSSSSSEARSSTVHRSRSTSLLDAGCVTTGSLLRLEDVTCALSCRLRFCCGLGVGQTCDLPGRWTGVCAGQGLLVKTVPFAELGMLCSMLFFTGNTSKPISGSVNAAFADHCAALHRTVQRCVSPASSLSHRCLRYACVAQIQCLFGRVWSSLKQCCKSKLGKSVQAV